MYPMEALTLLNVTADIPKVFLCFLYSFIIVPAMVFVLIFRYLTIFNNDQNSQS